MIENLLFDLGGVIMDIDKNLCVAAFERLGMTDASKFFGDYAQKGAFLALEGGRIDVDEFHRQVSEFLPADITDEQIDSAFCDFLIGIPEHRLAELRALRKNRRVYMLSNTNPIMWRSKIKHEFEKEGLVREDYFDGIVTSFEARSLKPDRAIFKYAAEHLGINPADTLFLDDSQTNLDAAARVGFATLLVPPGSEFAELLAEIDIK